MDMKITSQGGNCHVQLYGQFTFTDNAAFKEVISLAEKNDIRDFTLDFSGVDFIDSAVLGMLMILRNAAANQGKTVTIRGAKGQVEKVMRLSQFDTKFTMI